MLFVYPLVQIYCPNALNGGVFSDFPIGSELFVFFIHQQGAHYGFGIPSLNTTYLYESIASLPVRTNIEDLLLIHLTAGALYD